MTQREEILDRKPKTEKKVKKPSLYKVFILNDDYTTMEFVIQILQTIFRKTLEEAEQITIDVHNTGKGLAGIYTFDIAETKAQEVIFTARKSRFPLIAIIEKE